MNNLTTPCRGCTFETGRSVNPNCHEYCTEYRRFYDANEKRKQEIYEAKQKDKQYTEHIIQENARTYYSRKSRR